MVKGGVVLVFHNADVKDFVLLSLGQFQSVMPYLVWDPADPDAEVLEWVPTKLAHAPEGERWLMDPDIVYFFTDGSCTPARISWAEEGVSDREAEKFFLTVTGYCAPIP